MDDADSHARRLEAVQMATTRKRCREAKPTHALAGARVLITALDADLGLDVVRIFADVGAKLTLYAPNANRELSDLTASLSASSGAIELLSDPVADDAAAVRVAQVAAQRLGGLDVAINLALIDDTTLALDAGPHEVEDRIIATLRRPFYITQVVANRMRLTWKEGAIINAVIQRAPRTKAGTYVGHVARAALGTLTRLAADRWADKSLTINGIMLGSEHQCSLGSTPTGQNAEQQLATLALFLAGEKGRALSGLIFDATPTCAA